ncbi:hypothetical protein ACFV4E_22575 [Streptomyces hygroscopicus]|uniref:hypothetical protein n=1 Tax=Streptomyces hygroscopicus TaxID=1912 RepID=UPI00367CE48A
MTIQPNTTPTPLAPAAEPGLAETARALDERIVRSADVLYAHLTAGTLEAVGRPRLLPTALWSDADPEVVQAIWDLALTVGWLGGQRAAESRRWEHERLRSARDELSAAGYVAMAERIARVLPAPPPAGVHPADGETGGLSAVRGGRS